MNIMPNNNEDVKQIDICFKVRELCEKAGVDFLFIMDSKSTWSIKKEGHLRDVARYHKATENGVSVEEERIP